MRGKLPVVLAVLGLVTIAILVAIAVQTPAPNQDRLTITRYLESEYGATGLQLLEWGEAEPARDRKYLSLKNETVDVSSLLEYDSSAVAIRLKFKSKGKLNDAVFIVESKSGMRRVRAEVDPDRFLPASK